MLTIQFMGYKHEPLDKLQAEIAQAIANGDKSIYALSVDSGVAVNTIRNWLNGSRRTSIYNMVKVVRAFGYPSVEESDIMIRLLVRNRK